MGATIYRGALCSRVCVNLDRQADFGGRVLDGGSEVARQNYILYVSLAHTPNQMAKSLMHGVSLYLGTVKYQTHIILSLNAKCTVSHSNLAINTKRPAGA